MLYPKNLKTVEKQIKALSIKYYNESIDFAKDDHISNAIEHLKKSVEYDKTNVPAQNLLGLMYYRLGRVTNAYIHWSVSLSVDKSESNSAIQYLNDMTLGVDYEKKAKAISKYNLALEQVRQGNYDMAIMSLKRALDFNSKSVDVLNLLAYCYIVNNNNHDANRHIDTVLKIDKSNPIAKGYQKAIKPDRLSIFKSKEDNENGIYSVNVNNNAAKSNTKSNIAFFLLGLLVTSIICGAMVIPLAFKHYEREISSYETDYGVLKNQTDEELAKKDETIKSLTQENESLKSKLDSAGSNGLQERVKALAEIENMYDAGNVEVAADRLVALSNEGFTGEVMEQYRKLCSMVLVSAADRYFEKGQEAQEAENYADAITAYNKCLKCSQDGGEIGLSATFQLGKIAVAQGDNASAAKYFRIVAEKHPIESIKNEAATFLNQYNNS